MSHLLGDGSASVNTGRIVIELRFTAHDSFLEEKMKIKLVFAALIVAVTFLTVELINAESEKKMNEQTMKNLSTAMHGEAFAYAMRPDELIPSLPHEDAMRNAPQTDGTFFKVPKVIER